MVVDCAFVCVGVSECACLCGYCCVVVCCCQVCDELLRVVCFVWLAWCCMCVSLCYWCLFGDCELFALLCVCRDVLVCC